MDNKNDIDLKVFNVAKFYSEKILFPLMENYQKFQRISDFGAESIEEAMNIPSDIRELQRFNGLKGANDTVYNLLTTISSTIRLKGNREEIKQLDDLLKTLNKTKTIFYNDRTRFFITTLRGSSMAESLDRDYFEKIKMIISTCYINAEILMTKNKLLFADSKDEFLSDGEIKEGIMKDYVDG